MKTLPLIAAALLFSPAYGQIPSTLLHSLPPPVGGGQLGDQFGEWVAVSGTLVVVGAPYDDVGATDAGSAYVYNLASATPTVPVYILNNPAPAAGDLFGHSVGISGTRVVVGSHWDDTGVVDSGSAYVYDLSSGTPTVPTHVLSNPAPAAADLFGYSVAISGTRVVVSAYADDAGAGNAGTAYVYDVSGVPPLAPTHVLNNPFPGVNDIFGYAVAISGTRIVVTALQDDTVGTDTGSAYVYDVGSGTPTTPVAVLNNPTPATTDFFGYSAAISGSRVVVGAVYDDTNATDAGSAYVYDMTSDTPGVPVLTLNNPGPAANEDFGHTVAISGQYVYVAATNDGTGGAGSGTVYGFDLASGTPAIPVATLTNPTPNADDDFGLGLAFAGTTLVVGAHWDDTISSNKGFAYIYGLTPATQMVNFTTGMDASVVVGQANFTDQLTTASQTVMPGASEAAVSVTGKLAISGESSRRVLLWNAVPTTNGVPADVVIGQPNFSSTAAGPVTASSLSVCYGVCFSPDGTKLIASDYAAHRVLVWNTIPTVNGATADVVIGQVDFTSSSAGLTAAKLSGPTSVTVTPDGKLLVADFLNNRVLIYNSIPTTNGASADLVVGQSNMTTATSGNAANQMNRPRYCVATAGGKLLVGEAFNHRVTVFNTFPSANGASADLVIGQAGFGTSASGTNATALNVPVGVAVSPSGQLAIGDFANNRTLIYNSLPTISGAAADVVLGQPDFTSSTSFNGGVTAHSMSGVNGVIFTQDGRLLVTGPGMNRTMIFGSTDQPAPVSGSLGDVVTGGNAPDGTGADTGLDYDMLTRGGFIAENGSLAFPGELTGPGVDGTNFKGFWKHNGTLLSRLARTGDNAPETGATAAKFSDLPLIPGINDAGQVTLFAALATNPSSTPPTTIDNDTGLWSELGGTGFQILMREGDDIPTQVPPLPAGTKLGAFGSGCFATADTGGGTAQAAFTVKFKGGSTDSALLRASILNDTVTAVDVVARENDAAPGVAGQSFSTLNSTYTGAVRMDAQGNIVFGAALKPSNKSSIWYQPVAGGDPTAAVVSGNAAPGTSGATFAGVDVPVMGDSGTFAFRGVLTPNTGDNTGNAKNDGIWRGTATGPFTNILRRGDSNTNRPGLFTGAFLVANPSVKAGNIWSGWLNNSNHGAWLGWVDLAGNGISAYPADTFGIYTDLSGTMNLLISSGDPAPGIAGATLFFVDHPVVSGTAPTEHLAFIATVTGGGTTAANNKGIWRSLNGAAPTLVLRTGDSMTVTPGGAKTIDTLDLPGSGDASHTWETPVMDANGRLLVFVTFTDGTTTQVIVP